MAPNLDDLGLRRGSIWTKRLAYEAEQTVPRPGGLLPVEGGVMHYVVTGATDAPTLVMIHGIAGQLQHFTYAMVGLLKGDFRVIAVDRPGCGYSTLTSGDGASLGDQARMIDALLAELEVEQAVLVGHSLGGAVALRMALDHPDRVGALALLCPLSQAQPKAPAALRGLQVSNSRLRHFLSKTIAVPIAKLTANKVLAQAFKPETVPDDFMERAGAVLGLRPAAYVAACSDMSAVDLEMPGQAARYGSELQAKGGVLFGAQDDLLLPEMHGDSMKAHGLTCETLPGRGHMIPLTAAQECADFVRQVVRQSL